MGLIHTANIQSLQLFQEKITTSLVLKSNSTPFFNLGVKGPVKTNISNFQVTLWALSTTHIHFNLV